MAGPPKLPKKPPSSAKRPNVPPPRAKQHVAKTFSVQPWTGEGQGEKIVLYGGSGSGKTTLASMLPGATFIGLDDGGRKIKNPLTGEPVRHVAGVETFEDVRDALHQLSLWASGSSCVVDTLTMLETWAEPWMFENILHEKGGHVASLEGYGYGKGYTHLFETMRLVLQDLDALVRQGTNVCLICQNMAVKRANPGGLDFLEDGPKLSHPSSEKNSVRLHVCEWADQVFRLGYYGMMVEGGKDARLGKASGENHRAIYTMPEPHFFAKTRTLQDPVIAFEEPSDDSLWRLLFPEGYNG